MSRGANQQRGPIEHKDAGRLEQKRLAKPFSVQTTGDEGQIEGHGAVFNDPHPTSSWALDFDWNDVIAPGAFAATLAEHAKRGTTPLMLYMHERGNIPGAWRSISEDKDGLKLVGNVSKAAISPSGVPTYELLKMGAMNGLSIGFRVRKAELDEEAKTRTILDVELAEISLVDIPGGPNARITDVKSGDPHNIQFLETILRDAGLSRKEAKAVLAKGFSALRDAEPNDEPTQRDAGRGGGGTDAKSLAAQVRAFTQTIRPPGQE